MDNEKVNAIARKSAGGEPKVGTFTGYVEALAAGSDSIESLASELLIELRDVMERELRRRSLWSSPPSYVGIYGCAQWVPAADEPIPTATPLDELLADCYLFIFGEENLARLLNKVRINPIDGLVVFLLRTFLLHRQKLHDPLGYRVFEVLRGAVKASVEAGELRVVEGTRKIRNDTVLAVTPGATASDAAPIETLRPIVARWSDRLLPGLIIARYRDRARLNVSLREELFNLEAEGVAAFGFKPLVDALKEDVRARWASLYDQEEGEAAVEAGDEARTVVRVFRPSQLRQDAAAFEKLLECVADRIEKSGGRERTRRYLRRLWSFLRHFVHRDDDESLPTLRGLAKLLSIPRGRIPGLYESLGQFVRRCQGLLSAPLVEMYPEGRRGGEDG